MSIEPNKVSLALAQTAGLIYVVCAALVAIAPKLAWQLAGWLSHMTNLEVLGRNLTFGGFLIGLAQVLVYAYLSGWLFAKMYNRALGLK